jgi:hypothetical protein
MRARQRPMRHTPSIGKQGPSNAIKGRKIDVEDSAGKRTRLELDRQTELCTCDPGPGLATLFAVSSLVPHREDSDVAEPVCGSRAGATFRLAMISIRSA